MSSLFEEALKLPLAERIAIAVALYESILNTNNYQIEERAEIERRINNLRQLEVANGDKH